MAVRIYKPTTAARRKSSVQDFSDITKKDPTKSLIYKKKSTGGRNNTGHITVRHRGGGVARLYRIVDFKQFRYDAPATVTAIEYDPNRNARIALISYQDGTQSYILAPVGVQVGGSIVSSKSKIEAKPGMRMPLEYIPAGMFVHNLELQPGKGGQLVRGAGTSAQLMVIEGKFAQIKLPSGEMRLVNKACCATIGQMGNEDYKLIRWGKAGRRRHLGWRPTVKGKNMNPVDHPHGGGEGHSPIGLRKGPRTKWGKPARGVKTRKQHQSDKFIVSRRKK
ncbi:MAG: 50S ribosomal protein L2 [Candidatus Magasanikbacteria bacterium]